MDLNSTTLTGQSVHDQIQNPNKASSYILNGKIMLCSVIVLFVVVLILICFQSYNRWLFHRRHHGHGHRHRHSHRLFRLSTSTSTNTTGGDNSVNAAQPLDLSVLKRLPSFVFSSKTHDRLLDCAVCLSEFGDNEKGRVLPTCQHSFHADCIDMWFHSHSNCPLCRTPVQLPPVEDAVSVIEPAGSVSEGDLGVVHQMDCSTSSSSSSLPPVELVSVLVEIPRAGLNGFGK